MLGKLITACRRIARSRERAALSAELNGIYETRRFFYLREKQIMARVKKLDTVEFHEQAQIRKAKAW